MVLPSTPPAAGRSRSALRAHLRALREQFAASPAFGAAEQSLARELAALLARLEPDRLGVYWPVQSEFNVATLWQGDKGSTSWQLALPFAQRTPRQMHYRVWDGSPPDTPDECGIASIRGPAVVPEVVLVPCVGFTAQGYRLGYGGGYFDRWLAANAHVTAVGVAWSVSRLDEAEFAPEPHDLPLSLVVTEQGVVGS